MSTPPHLLDSEVAALRAHPDLDVRIAAVAAFNALEVSQAASRAHERGSADRETALRLEADVVVAASARRHYRRELEELLARLGRA